MVRLSLLVDVKKQTCQSDQLLFWSLPQWQGDRHA
jgi:hypothetical protein